MIHTALKTGSTEHKDTKAWEAGFKAGEEGKPVNKCPHIVGSVQAQSWQQGHAQGTARRKNAKEWAS